MIIVAFTLSHTTLGFGSLGSKTLKSSGRIGKGVRLIHLIHHTVSASSLCDQNSKLINWTLFFFLPVVVSVHSKRLCQRLSNYVISQQSPLLQNVQILSKSNYSFKRFSITKRKVDQLSELTLVCISIIAIVKWSVFLSQLLATGVRIPGFCLFPCSWQKARKSEKVFSLYVVNQYFSLFMEVIAFIIIQYQRSW